MKKISEKSITDLEFDIVLQQAAERCATDLGKKALLDLLPLVLRVFFLQKNYLELRIKTVFSNPIALEFATTDCTTHKPHR